MLGMIRRTYERTALDKGKSASESLCLVFVELLRGNVVYHRKMALCRLQILPYGEHPATVSQKVVESSEYLIFVLTQPKHHSALGSKTLVGNVSQDG